MHGENNQCFVLFMFLREGVEPFAPVLAPGISTDDDFYANAFVAEEIAL